jgi:hypothetical protein
MLLRQVIFSNKALFPKTRGTKGTSIARAKLVKKLEI